MPIVLDCILKYQNWSISTAMLKQSTFMYRVIYYPTVLHRLMMMNAQNEYKYYAVFVLQRTG